MAGGAYIYILTAKPIVILLINCKVQFFNDAIESTS